MIWARGSVSGGGTEQSTQMPRLRQGQGRGRGEVAHDDASSLSFPSLSVLSTRMRMVEGTYAETDQVQAAAYSALRTTRDFLRFLQTYPPLTTWEKSMIRVSTVTPRRIQSAGELGTPPMDTSITFGAAVDFLRTYRAHTHVLMLSCGTGTMEFRLYGRQAGGQIRPLYVYLPEAAPKTSLSSLLSHPVTPGRVEDFCAQGTQWLAQFVAFLASIGLQTVPVAALVTGNIQAWWEANPDTRSTVEDGVAEILYAICPTIVAATGISFFLTQAMQEMHAYTALAAVVEAGGDGPKPRTVLLGVCIGHGSTQIPFRTAASTVDVISVPVGMQHREMAVGMVRVGAMAAMDAFVPQVRQALVDGRIPVVVLHAGALCAYTDTHRILEGSGAIVDALLRDLVARVPSAAACRSVAMTSRQQVLWNVELKRNGTTDASSRQDMMAAIWTAAPDRIHLLHEDCDRWPKRPFGSYTS